MAGSHYTYIPIFSEEYKDENWRKELQEILSTLRLCTKCNTFQEFFLTKKEPMWFYISCPFCRETIQIPRKRNQAAKKSLKEKWK